jgi:hypothetical protein
VRKYSIFAAAVTAALAPLLVVVAVKFNADLPEWSPERPRAAAPRPSVAHGGPQPLPPFIAYDGPQPPTPPPHVVVMRQEGSGNIRILHRDGWVRTESQDIPFSGFSLQSPGDVRYGASFSADGARHLMLARGAFPRAVYQPTGRRETALGERCKVWTSEPLVQERVYGGPVLSCITADGIVLWTGRRQHYARAVSLERRPIAWSEMLPPRELLSWSYWAHHFPVPPESATPAYEIGFTGGIQRLHGELTSYSDDEGNYWLRNRDAAFVYSVVRGGEAYTLHTRIEPQLPVPSPALDDDATPMDRPPSRIRGERCNWYRTDPHASWGMFSRCVTDDGIALVRVTDHYDNTEQPDERYVATHFRRGAPSAASMMPPRGLFDPWLSALPN